ncbi:PD-(D/E)XK nuclease superfamily protein [Candidatus Electrothrix aarhusensis]|uniref:PD-(D/E)XK nuclease superfamily protein n=1 Tax=Candidatus Electrothrix aarhusensis TaxID=1859131 RepID=A0A444IWS0_9BACT|nr:PD-(D/E)XK nuclease superfamily protein [Candidatus Electrothrix aarhusensis]
MKKRILYGIANYAELVEKNGYFVDKTSWLAELEQVNNPVFLRPRRFGKSLLCSLLNHYYDLNTAGRFSELFGHTWIGQHPTGKQNSCFILHLNFSVIEPGKTLGAIERSFKVHCNYLIKYMRNKYALLKDMPEIDTDDPVSDCLGRLLSYLHDHQLPPLYIIIDEYDNFANQLVTANKDQLYRELTADNGFFKTFFKILKQGRETQSISNVFITGVLPITMDDMASGFNVATFLTLDPRFENMLGFTQAETDTLVDAVFQDQNLDPTTRSEVGTLMKNQYNGYQLITDDGESLYNSTSVLYFLNWLQNHKTIPKHLTDLNLKTDISWVRRLTASNPALTEEFVDRLTLHNSIAYDDTFLVEKFNMYQFFEPSFFPISFFYLGMLTRKDDFFLCLPNMNMRTIFVQYFNEIHHIDVSTRYAEIMQAFANKPDLEQLFAGYWQEYVSQLPEAIFQQVNENFYRTTFYELCSRFLSRWFVWHVERSYPQGRSDLEFVGKYNEKYAGLRWVVEFKYFSNTELRKMKTSIEDFQVRIEDTEQINGYAEGLRAEYPKAEISKFVIYCFGNQGFRVFQAM